MLSEIFIHIGYPKTATTTLQNNVFAKLSNIDIVGKPQTKQNKNMLNLIHMITDCEKIEYRKEYVLDLLKKLNLKNKRLLLTEETFSTGSTLSGRVDRKDIAIRLKELFPNAKINNRIVLFAKNKTR